MLSQSSVCQGVTFCFVRITKLAHKILSGLTSFTNTFVNLLLVTMEGVTTVKEEAGTLFYNDRQTSPKNRLI